MIHIALSTDLKGFAYCATLIASIARRTTSNIHIKCWCRKFLPKSFEVRHLKVDFFRQDEEIGGSYPGHVPGAVFDRLRVIPEATDWERCLIMDHDMIVLCDLADYFAEDFEGNLLMGRLFGEGNTLGLQVSQRGGLPEAWKDTSWHPYFYMGPMMNLKMMREVGTWEKLLDAHSAIGFDEQISLTAACDGLVKGVSPRWNIVPQWDKLSEIENHFGGYPRGEAIYKKIPLINGIPSGIIHWTGGYKPWSHGTRVWRHDIWEAEKSSWEQLQEGNWDKPVVAEWAPSNGLAIRALARRGCRVVVGGCNVHSQRSIIPLLDQQDAPFPDVDIVHSIDEFSSIHRIAQIRFGVESELKAIAALKCPQIIISGPRPAEDIIEIMKLGYTSQKSIVNREWPTGGPLASIMDYTAHYEADDLAHGEDLYLQWQDTPVSEVRLSTSVPSILLADQSDFPFSTNAQLEHFIREDLTQFVSGNPQILELGISYSATILKEVFPDSHLTTWEHNVTHFSKFSRLLPKKMRHQLVYAALDQTLPWYACDVIPENPINLLIVNGPSMHLRKNATCLQACLATDAVIILPKDHNDNTTVEEWKHHGWNLIISNEDFAVFQNQLPASPRARLHKNLHDVAEKIYVISLPHRKDRRESLDNNWRDFPGAYEVVNGVTPESSTITWQEMKGMEAYGKSDNLRTNYIIGAVGCKRAGIRAIQAFLSSGAQTALICQDDCHWKKGADLMIQKSISELPDDWDLLYFSASARKAHLPYSPHLARLQGARLCTAVLWTRKAAERLIGQLEQSDCEWDLFMEKQHKVLRCFLAIPMPAFQAKSYSDITRTTRVVSNH